MGGEIKVVKKDGPGTLMQLYIVLGMPEDGTGKHFQADFSEHSLMVSEANRNLIASTFFIF